MNVQKTRATIPPEKEKRWKALLKAAFAEKKWTNERLVWLFTPQGVLFAAFGLLLTKDTNSLLDALRCKLLICISIVGGATALVVFFSVLAAARMHHKWTKKMRKIAKKFPHAVTFGNRPYWPSNIARWAPVCMPLLFIAVWLFIGISVHCSSAHL